MSDNDGWVSLIWERNNTPYELGHTLLEIFYDKDKAEAKCKELNDKANRDYQEELRLLGGQNPMRSSYPRYSYHVNQWRIN